MPTAYNRIDKNKNATILFLGVFIIFLICAVCIVDILLLKNHFASCVVLISLMIVCLRDYIFSNKLILRKNKAVFLSRAKNKELHKIVENLCMSAGILTPKLFATNDLAINAFTIGRNQENASIIFTAGALKKLNKLELEGVISHELAHIKNNDILLATALAFLLGFVRAIVDLAKHFADIVFDFISCEAHILKILVIGMFYSFLIFILLLILALSFIPVIEELIFYKISRKREFLADAEGALLTRYPKGLQNALEKISADCEKLKTINSSTAHLYIASPFKNKLKNFWSRLFHSHPPIKKRIEMLKKMDEGGKFKNIV